jgi:hypothetical protein
MAMGKKFEKAKDTASRLQGLSIMGFGVSFKAKPTDRETLSRLFIFLEDRRVFKFRARPHAAFGGMASSLHKIREELTEAMRDVGESSPAFPVFKAMRADCRSLLRYLQPASEGGSDPEEDDPKASLEEVRDEILKFQKSFGPCVGLLADKYTLTIDEHLKEIVPLRT